MWCAYRKHNDDLPRSRAAISTGKGRRLGLLVLLPHHLRLDGPDGEKAPASNRVFQFFALFGCGAAGTATSRARPVHALIRQEGTMLRFIPISDPAQAAAPGPCLGKSDCTVTKPASPAHGVTPEAAGRRGLVCQLTNYKTLGLSRHIGTTSGPSLGVIQRSEKLPTIGCSGLHASKV